MTKFKKILYVSNLCSPGLLENIFNTATIKPGLQIQKFHRLIVEGLYQQEGTFELELLSTLPIVPSSHKRKFWNIKKEIDQNIIYSYVPMINVPFLKSITVFFGSIIKISLWIISDRKKSKVVYCDALNFALSFSTLIMCKITRTKIIGIVTDIPGMIIPSSSAKKNLESMMHDTLRLKMFSNYDGYVFLTEQMNELINHHHKPYIVVEGTVDINMKKSDNLLDSKGPQKILIYAGGIYEEYGVKKLIEAFMQISGSNLLLHIYGSGEMEKDMPYYSGRDKRIIYLGIVPNEIVVNNQLSATLLINPRPSNNDFTKYSFPSKNMEYMVSGTPLVTTPLPGMPEEYMQFVYLFNDESVDGMCKTLQLLLSKSSAELHNFGYIAKQFVLNHKNNHIQAQRITNLLESII